MQLTALASLTGYNQGRTAGAWRESLAQQWIKLFLVPPPVSTEHYDQLKSPMDIEGGESGEVEKYMLEVGGLSKEVALLEGTEERRREGVRALEVQGSGSGY